MEIVDFFVVEVIKNFHHFLVDTYGYHLRRLHYRPISDDPYLVQYECPGKLYTTRIDFKLNSSPQDLIMKYGKYQTNPQMLNRLDSIISIVISRVPSIGGVYNEESFWSTKDKVSVEEAMKSEKVENVFRQPVYEDAIPNILARSKQFICSNLLSAVHNSS